MGQCEELLDVEVQVPGTRAQNTEEDGTQGARSKEQGARSKEHGARNTEQGTRSKGQVASALGLPQLRVVPSPYVEPLAR